MSAFRWFFVAAFLGLMLSEPAALLAATGINDQISFQGKVVNTNGTNVANGNYDFVFRLYTVSSGGTAAWTETWNSGTAQVTVTDGIFQVNLGTHTDLPGSIDFNTDNIYLGIEFNGDGEMSPRVHFTAAPYAFNAMRVGGLTVTDTTGTLTVPNGETISFGGSFTTSASNDVALTTSGATNVTLPTTGTLATLAGVETLTNKTIGSTGLTFSGATTDITTTSGEDLTLTAAGAGVIVLSDSVTSGALTISGATTDITTASGESLVLVANGAGTIDLQDATTADSLTLDSGGLTLQNGETIGNGTDDIIAFTGAGGADNTDLFLDLDGTSPVLSSNTDVRVSVDDYLNVQVSGVTGAAAGDIWYDSAANKFKINENGTTKILCNTTDLGCSAGGTATLQDTYGNDADGSNATISLTTADDSLVITNPSSSGTDSAFVLQVTQQNTTAAVSVLDLIQSSNAANAVNLTANSIDTETALAITANGLTSGSAVTASSSAAANFTGTLASLTLSDGTGAASNTGSLLTLTNSGTANANTSLVIQHNATGTGNLAFRVNDAASDTTPFVIDGNGNVGIGNDTTPVALLTVGAGDVFQVDSNGLTTATQRIYINRATSGTSELQLRFSNAGSSVVGLEVPIGSGDLTFFNNEGGASTAEIARFTNVTGELNGNFGIGDASPDGRLDFDLTSTNTTAGTRYGANFTVSDTGVVTTGTDTTYGQSLSVTRTGATGGTITTYGIDVAVTADAAGAGTSTATGVNIAVSGADTNYALLTSGGNVGIGDATPGSLLTVGSGDLFEVDSAGAIVDVRGITNTGTISSTGAIAANGGITFDASTDTVGAFTAAGTIDLNSNILTNIGNSGTDFVASTGALTLAGVLTANGGITLASSQTFTASSLSYMDLGAITHGTTAVQGLRLPQAASASPSNPSANEGYLAWDSSGNQLIVYNGSAWATVGGGSAEDLQTTYAADADGSDATISLTTADDSLIFTNPTSSGTDSAYLLFLNQQNTTGVVSALDITQASNASNAVNLTANSIDTETGLAISATGLTTGYAQTIAVNAATTLTSGGALSITGPTGAAAQAAGSLLLINTTGAVTGTDGSGNSLQVSSATVTGTVASITGTGVMTTTGDLLTLTANSATTPTGLLTVNANGLTSGNAVNIASSSTAITSASLLTATFSGAPAASWTGDLAKFEATSADVDVDGNALKVGLTGTAAGSGTALMVTTAQSGTGALALRVNDDGTYADASAFVIDAAGNVGIAGDTTPATALDVNGSITIASSSVLTSTGGVGTNNLYVYDSSGGMSFEITSAGSDEFWFEGGDIRNNLTFGGHDTAFQAFFSGATVLSSALTGLDLSLSTNVTATGQSVTGTSVALPTVTNTGASTYNYRGLVVTGGAITQTTAAGTNNFNGVAVTNSNLTQTTGTLTANGVSVTTGTITTGGTQRGMNVTATGVGAGTLQGINISSITGAGGTETAIEIGAGWDTGINLNANILTNIGNSGTDFVASTGALTLAGVLTANGGITLASSQTFTASSLSYMDLGAITHGTTAVQGLRLPQAASASPSNPTSGEGYLAWDSSGNQVIYYNGSAWATFGAGGGYATIKDESTSLTQRTTLAFLGAGVTCADNVTQTECTIAGGSGADLQGTYDTGSAGDQIISLDSTQDSIIVRNPSSAGTDSAFIFKAEQLNTGVAKDTLYADNRGTGNGLRIDDESGDTTPFIVDGNGSVGIGTSSVATNGSTAAGERLLQVGSATNRGDAAIYGELTNKGYKQALGISGIIDVFVYDTTKDSDAGRWRTDENTNFKSWYTETKDDGIGDACAPATDDRCGPSAFPAKAVLATTADALYIFDAKDNKMFMKFSQNASGYALGVDTNNNPTGVFGLNGTIYVGTNGASAGGLYAFDFPNDRLYNYNTTDRDMGNQNIANRNSAVTYNVGSITSFAIANNAVNDVHGAVISGSGAVAANNGTTTGKTFIVAATDSSASLIDLSGSKVFEFGDTATDDVNQVWLTSRARLYLTNETLSQVELYTAVDQDVADQVTPDDIYDEQTGNTPSLAKTAPTMSTSPDALQVLERESAADANYALALGTVNSLPNGDVLYVGHSLGLTEIHTAGAPSTAVIGWSKFYTTTTETAYMSGTPRGMFTMDDASGDVTDATIRNNVLEAKGTPTYGVNGVHGLAMSFNGTSQYLCSDTNNDATCDQDTDFDAGTLGFTVEAWFKKSAISGTDTLIDHTYSTTPALTAGWRVWMNSSGQIQAGIDDDATAFDDDIIAGAGPSLADGQWHHVVFTRVSTAFAAPNPPVAVGIYLFVDGKLVGSDTTIAATATLTVVNTILGIGADCSVGANCGTGANFWDGQIDDVYISMNGATTSDSLNAAGGAIARRYSEGKAALLRPSTRITDATTTSADTIGDSGAAYVGNEFVGQIVEITGGTGAGQTRKIVSNTATTFTVSPNWTVTPDTTSDYEVMPEQLYGSSNSVTAIAITETDPLRTSRTLYVGTNSGGDGGGVSVFSGGAGHPSVSDVYHADAAYEADDSTDWTGSGYDDMRSIDVRSGVLAMGSASNLWEVRADRSLEQSIDLLTNALNGVRQELMADTLQANSINPGGADLAEYYYSDAPLLPGTVVALDPKREAYVQETAVAYERNLLGVVATNPGIVLGDVSTNGYPVALVGRVPVRVTLEGGQIRSGDPITSASRSGFGMRAVQAGRMLGTALSDAGDWLPCEGEDYSDPNALLCTTVMVFVNLSHYYGQSVELAMAERANAAGLNAALPEENGETGLAGEETIVRLATAEPTREEQIMQFLKEVRDEKAQYASQSSEVFTDRVAASTEIITPKLVVEELFAKTIKADSIEGLAIYTNRIASLEAKYAGLAPEAEPAGDTEVSSEKTWLNLEQFSVGSLSVALDASLLGKLSVTGALTVADAAQFEGETTFARLATFMSETLFRGPVAFERPPTFSADTAGFAMIAEGAKRVRVEFDEPYARQPIVAVTMTRETSPILDGADESLRADIEIVEAEYAQEVFADDVRYMVTEKDQTGFTILLAKEAPADLSFSWVAIAVSQPKTSAAAVQDAGDTAMEETAPIASPEIVTPSSFGPESQSMLEPSPGSETTQEGTPLPQDLPQQSVPSGKGTL